MRTVASLRWQRNGPPRRIAWAVMLLVIAFVPAGCAKFLGEQAGTITGKVTGSAAAQALPPPRATIVTNPQGGRFCPVSEANGWPGTPYSDPEIDALSDEHAITIDNTLAHGERFCGWKP